MSAALRVACNVAAIPLEALGAGQYAVELVRALGAHDDVAMNLITRRDDGARWALIDPHARIASVAPDGRAARLAWEELGLSRSVDNLDGGVDVLHGPHYALPARSRVPAVVTIHDLTFVDHPEWHERSKVAYFQRALRLAAKRAAVVLCVSDRTAARFIELYHPHVPVRIVAHGVNHERFRPFESTAGDDERVLERLRVGPHYLLHTGTIQPRKDLPTLVAAFDRVVAKHPDCSLVLAGGSGWDTGELDRAIATSPAQARIHRLGHVADDDVPALVRRAALVAYPSLEEGFGLPALEAMACGTPLVTTDDSVMSDLAAGAAWLVARGDPSGLAEALLDALDGGPEVAHRRQLGLERAAMFTWEACAAGHVDAYRLAADR